MSNIHRIEALVRAGIAVYVAVLVLALYPYTPDPAFDIKIIITHWAAALLPMPLLGAAVFLDRPLRRPTFLFGPFLFVVVLNAIACFLSPYTGHSLSKVTYILSLFLLYLVASQVYTTPEQVRRLMYIACGAVALSSIYAMFQKVGLDPFPWDEQMLLLEEYTNLPGTFGNPNVAGHTLVLAIVTAGYLASQKSGRWCLALVALFLVHILLTHHRAGLLGVTFAFSVFAAAAARRIWEPWSIPIRAGAVIGVLLVGAIGLSGWIGVGKAGVAPLDSSILLRYNANHGAARMIVEKPLTGYGPRNYEIVNPPFWTGYEQEYFSRERKMNDHVHNEFLQAAVDAGLPAAAAYLALLIAGACTGWMLIRHHSEPDYRRLGLFYALFFAVFMIDGFFGFNFRSPVSGVLLAVFAGTLEGIRMPAAQPHRRTGKRTAGVAFAGIAIVLVLTNAALATRAFASRTLLQFGRGAIHWNYLEQADELLARAEGYAPGNWVIPFHRGTITGDRQAAVQHFERSLARNPNYLPSLTALAQFAFDADAIRIGSEEPPQFQLSNEYAGRIQELCPVLPEGEELLGNIALARAAWFKQYAPDQAAVIELELQEARQRLASALAHGAENDSHLYHVLAETLYFLDEFDAALDAYHEAVGSAPGRTEIWMSYYHRAHELNRLERYREDFRDGYDALVQGNATIPPSLDAIAAAWSDTPAGTSRAASILGAAVQNLGETVPSPARHAELAWVAGLVFDAFSTAAPTGTDAGGAYLNMGITLYRIGELARAENMAVQAVSLLTGEEQLIAIRFHADVLIQLDRNDEAETVLREAVLDNPRELDLRLAFARLLANRDKAAQALSQFTEILRTFRFDENTRNALQQEMMQLQ